MFKNHDSLYSLMVMSGYLKAVPAGDGMYSVSIPNKEILKLIVDVAEDMCPIDSSKFTEFVRSVIDGGIGFRNVPREDISRSSEPDPLREPRGCAFRPPRSS